MILRYFIKFSDSTLFLYFQIMSGKVKRRAMCQNMKMKLIIGGLVGLIVLIIIIIIATGK